MIDEVLFLMVNHPDEWEEGYSLGRNGLVHRETCVVVSPLGDLWGPAGSVPIGWWERRRLINGYKNLVREKTLRAVERRLNV